MPAMEPPLVASTHGVDKVVDAVVDQAGAGGFEQAQAVPEAGIDRRLQPLQQAPARQADAQARERQRRAGRETPRRP